MTEEFDEDVVFEVRVAVFCWNLCRLLCHATRAPSFVTRFVSDR